MFVTLLGGLDALFGTIMGVSEVKGKPLWDILFNNKDVYDYNPSEVLDS